MHVLSVKRASMALAFAPRMPVRARMHAVFSGSVPTKKVDAWSVVKGVNVLSGVASMACARERAKAVSLMRHPALNMSVAVRGSSIAKRPQRANLTARVATMDIAVSRDVKAALPMTPVWRMVYAGSALRAASQRRGAAGRRKPVSTKASVSPAAEDVSRL